jgi:hypothetical protein
LAEELQRLAEVTRPPERVVPPIRWSSSSLDWLERQRRTGADSRPLFAFATRSACHHSASVPRSHVAVFRRCEQIG